MILPRNWYNFLGFVLQGYLWKSNAYLAMDNFWKFRTWAPKYFFGSQLVGIFYLNFLILTIFPKKFTISIKNLFLVVVVKIIQVPTSLCLMDQRLNYLDRKIQAHSELFEVHWWMKFISWITSSYKELLCIGTIHKT